MSLEMQTRSQPFTGILTKVLRCFSRVMCGEELIPSGLRFQDRLQMMGLIDPLVLASQNN
jgi:hypothetical protein